MRRVLSPDERLSEVLFGLIMALSFTCTISVAEAGRSEVRTMLWAALGCNTAWGIVDAVMYLLGTLADRGRRLALYRRYRAATGPEESRAALRDALPPLVSEAVTEAELDALRARLDRLDAPTPAVRLTFDDWRGAAGVFLLVLLSTIPVALPFVFISEPQRALRASNAVAVALLFAIGWGYGRYAGFRPWRMAAAMVAIGLACVGITIALGG